MEGVVTPVQNQAGFKPYHFEPGNKFLKTSNMASTLLMICSVPQHQILSLDCP